LAIERKNAQLVKDILDAGVSANVKDLSEKPWKGQSPIEHAIRCLDESTVRVLKDKFADINLINEDGLYPLQVAVRFTDKKEIINLLIGNNHDCFRVIEKTGENVYHLAAQAGHNEAINIFHSSDSNDSKIVASENINVQTKHEQKTPILIALEASKVSTAEYLLQKGASLALKDKDGNHPLLIAVRKNFDNFIEIAIKKASLEIQYDTLVELIKNKKSSFFIKITDILISGSSAENSLLNDGYDVSLRHPYATN
jgi:ankyrin repeat protein